MGRLKEEGLKEMDMAEVGSEDASESEENKALEETRTDADDGTTFAVINGVSSTGSP